VTRIRLLFLLNGAGIAVLGPFTSVILSGRGFAPAAIGLVSALTSLAYVLSVSVWGHLGDVVLGRARALGYAILGAAGLLVAFLLPLPPPLIAAAYVAYAACYGAVGPLSDALAVNAMRDPAREYGRVRGGSSAAFAVAAVLFGLLYGAVGYWPAGVMFLALAVAIASTARGVPDLGRAKLTAHRRGGAIREALAIQPAMAPILVAVGLAHVGVFAGFTFLSLRIVELGGAAPEVALSSSVAAATEVAAMVVASRLVPRIGIRGLFVGSVALYVVAFGLWAVLTSPVAIVASRVISGAAYSGLWISSVMTVQRLLPPRLQGSGQALVSMTTAGIAACLANVVGGLLYAGGGPAVLFGISAVLAVAGAVVGWATLPARGTRRLSMTGAEAGAATEVERAPAADDAPAAALPVAAAALPAGDLPDAGEPVAAGPA
jgi:PPP family 3-phenylpropionic acid transporter